MMRALLAAAGDPQAALRTVVVAGTKGKGSTAAMIEAIARAAGLRTGLFTSPHLSSYRERIQVGREPIGQAELARHRDHLFRELADFRVGSMFQLDLRHGDRRFEGGAPKLATIKLDSAWRAPPSR